MLEPTRESALKTLFTTFVGVGSRLDLLRLREKELVQKAPVLRAVTEHLASANHPRLTMTTQALLQTTQRPPTKPEL